jgi:ADP-ribosylglycohydrolase
MQINNQHLFYEAINGLYAAENKISTIDLSPLEQRSRDLKFFVFINRPITLLNSIMYDCLINYQKPNYRRYFTQLKKLFPLEDEQQLDFITKALGDNCAKSLLNFTQGKKPHLSGLPSEFNNNDSSLIIMLTKAFFLPLDNQQLSKETLKDIKMFTSLTNRHQRSLIGNVFLFSLINKIINRRINSNRPLTHKQLVISMRSGIKRAHKWISPSRHQQGEIGYYARLEYNRHHKKLHIENSSPNELHKNRYCVDVIVNLCYIISHYDNYRSAVIAAHKLMKEVHSLPAIVGFIYALAFTDRVIPKKWLIGNEKKEKCIDKLIQ